MAVTRTFDYRPEFTEVFDTNGQSLGTFKRILDKNQRLKSYQVIAPDFLLIETDAGSGSGVTTVTTLAALAALSVTDLTDGAFAYVQSIKSYFFLDKTSALTPDGITVVTAPTGQWLREKWAHPYWATQATWYIDATSGSDENSGSGAGTALKTHAELQRRLPSGTNISQSTTVTILTDLPASDPLNLQVTLSPGAQLLYTGTTPTVVGSYTITATTMRDRATNQLWLISDGVTDWTPYLGYRLKLTSGAGIGGVSWVYKNVGGGIMSTAEWAVNTPFSLTYVNPVFGDTFDVEQCVKCHVGSMDIVPLQDNTALGTPFFIMQDLEVSPGAPGERGFWQLFSRTSTNVIGCKLETAPTLFSGNQVVVQNCYSPQGYVVLGGWLWNEAGITKGNYSAHAIQAGAFIHLDGDILVAGEGAYVAPGAAIECGSACFVDNTGEAGYDEDGSGIWVESGGSFSQRYGVKGVRAIWGSGNAGYGLTAQPGAKVSLSGTPVVTGTSGDFKVGGTTTPRAWDDTLGSYTTTIAATWANWLAAIGAGGFGGNAHAVTTNTSIVTEGV